MPHARKTVGKKRDRELRQKRGSKRLNGWAKRQASKS